MLDNIVPVYLLTSWRILVCTETSRFTLRQ